MHREKGQPTEWEQLYKKHISDKELIDKIFKELLQLKKKKNLPNNPIKK